MKTFEYPPRRKRRLSTPGKKKKPALIKKMRITEAEAADVENIKITGFKVVV